MPTAIRAMAAVGIVSLSAVPAWAYVGPGAGLGLLGAFGALLTAVAAAIGFLVLWPLRMRRARRARATPVDASSGRCDAKRRR
jgi:hypothetical protein